MSKKANAREQILGKIRNGLSAGPLPMPYPEAEGDASVYQAMELSEEETFAAEFIRLGGRFVYCAGEQDLSAQLNLLCDQRGWQQVFCADRRLLQLFQSHQLHYIQPADPAIESAEACITACEYLVARTGSAMLSSRQDLGRIGSVFYPVHIIVAYSSQLVPDLQEGIQGIQQRYGQKLPSMINLNTGPSRTADIEKTLVVGVHGPREVFCFFVQQ